MGIGYYPENTVEFTPSKYAPKSYTWVVNLVGYTGFILSLLFAFFGGMILLIDSIRSVFLFSGIVALISAYILFALSKFLVVNYGVKYFYISENALVFDSPLTRPVAFSKKEIVHIGVEYPNPSLSILPLVSPKILIATYNKLYTFRTSRWQNQEELLRTLDRLSETVQDPFAEYYHKSKTTMYSFFIRMSQDTAGITGLTIIVIYLFLGIWGGMALMIDHNTLDPYVLFLRNPDFLNGFLDEYDQSTARYHPPSNDFWFGTDWIGRDIFARLVYGTSYTLLIALTGSLVSIFIVVIFGLTSQLTDKRHTV